ARVIVGVVARQRHREVETQSEIGQLLGVAGRAQPLAALEDLEDELLVLAALAAREQGQTLHRRSLDPHESPSAIDVENGSQRPVAQRDFVGQDIAHPARRGRRELHGHVTRARTGVATTDYSGTVMMIWVSPESRRRPVRRNTAMTRDGPASPGIAPRPVIIPSKPDCTTCMRKPAGPRYTTA